MLKFPLILIAYITTCFAYSDSFNPKKHPNIIIFFADDMGYGDCKVYNSKSSLQTPNINQLAKEGVRFLDAHSPATTCTPSRFGLLTGINPLWVGVKNNSLKKGKPLVGDKYPTIATMLKDNGYSTKMIGKWHLGFQRAADGKFDFEKPLRGGPVDSGFDYFYGLHSSPNSRELFYIKNRDAGEKPSEKVTFKMLRKDKLKTFKSDAAPGFKLEEVSPNLCKDAVRIIHDHAKSDGKKPLFLYYASTFPHEPWVPSKQFKGKSGLGDYGDVIMQLDDVVGQMNNALKETGLDKDTIFIFTSDNGPCPSATREMEKRQLSASGGLRGRKAQAYEGGHRVPFIVKWPGKVPSNQVSKTTINGTDVFATLAEIINIGQQKYFQKYESDSHSFLKAMLDPAKRYNRPPMLNSADSFRKDDWKLVAKRKVLDPNDLKENNLQLYNLRDDLIETKDLVKTHPEKATTLFKEFKEMTNKKYKNN